MGHTYSAPKPKTMTLFTTLPKRVPSSTIYHYLLQLDFDGMLPECTKKETTFKTAVGQFGMPPAIARAVQKQKPCNCAYRCPHGDHTFRSYTIGFTVFLKILKRSYLGTPRRRQSSSSGRRSPTPQATTADGTNRHTIVPLPQWKGPGRIPINQG